MFKKLLTSLFATTAIAATLCAAGTTAFAASVEEPLAPGGNVMAQASATDPARITLQDTAEGNYLLAVEPWAYEVSSAEPLVATVDDGDDKTEDAVTKTLESNVYMFGAYTAYFNLSPATTRLVITTGSATEIDLSVSLYAPVETTPLPVDAANPAVLTMWTEYTYSYTPATSGYFTMHWASQTTGAEFTVMEKVEPEYLSGTTVQDETYPLYLEAGQEVYFSVMYTGGNESETADVYFYFEAWEPAEIRLDRRVYVPITPADKDHVTMPFAATIVKPDTYVLRLSSEPVYPEGTVITAHIVDAEDHELSTATSYFNNLYEVTLTEEAAGVYFTSTHNEVFVGSVIASITPSESVNFTLGTPARVSLKSGEALTCFLTDVTATGTYNINLLDLPAASPVSVYDAYGTIVAEGATRGTFAVVMEYPNEYGYPGETTKNAALTFQNSSEGTVAFRVLITKNTENFDVELDKATTLQAPAHSSTVYYVPGLTGTLYGVHLTNAGADVLVYDYFNRYEPIVDATKPDGMYSFGDITLAEGRTLTYAFVVVNESDTAEELTITFTELNALYLDKQTPVEVAANGSEDYYMLNVTTGRYMITLSDISEGANYTVSYNNTAITFDNEHVGYFNVEVPEGSTDTTVVLTVKNNIATPLTLTAVVTATVDGTMTLGEPQEVTLGNNDASETYDINLEANVEYTVTLSGEIPTGVAVYVNINGTYVLYGETSATFTLTEAATRIEIGYSYYNVTYFTFTVTITQNIAS